MVQFHPHPEMLFDYAAGGLSDGLSLVVAAHLTFCPACRAEVARAEALGGATLAGTGAEGIAAPSLDAVLARLDLEPVAASAPAARLPAGRRSVLPAPILRRLGTDESGLAWKFRMPGLHEYVIEDGGPEAISLLRARPGAGMLAHTHRGDEATLVLSGEMQDRDAVLRRGDVSFADEADDHRPRIVGTEVCYCLIVMSGNLRFTGPFGRVLNIFTG